MTDLGFGLPYDIVRRIRSVLAKHAEVKLALVFGSRARGDFGQGSDIDLAIVADTRLGSGIRFELDEAVKLYKVGIVDLNDVPSTARPYREAKATPRPTRLRRMSMTIAQPPPVTARPTFRCMPDRVVGIPIRRASLPRAADNPIARFHENEKPYFLPIASPLPSVCGLEAR